MQIPNDASHSQTNPIDKQTYRIIDWMQASSLSMMLPVSAGVIVFLSLVGAANLLQLRGENIIAFSLVLALFAMLITFGLVIWSHFPGVLIDLNEDKLTFPILIGRRSIRFSAIRNANAVFIERRYTTPDFSAVFSGHGVKPPGDTIELENLHYLYAVDLSGPSFGARQVKFWSRKRQKQLLGYVLEFVPELGRLQRNWGPVRG